MFLWATAVAVLAAAVAVSAKPARKKPPPAPAPAAAPPGASAAPKPAGLDPVAAARAARLEILRGLDGADLVVFEPRRTPGDARLALAARVHTNADRLRALLG